MDRDGRPTRRRFLAGSAAVAGLVGTAHAATANGADRRGRPGGAPDGADVRWQVRPGPDGSYDVLFDAVPDGRGTLLAGAVGDDPGGDGWVVRVEDDGTVTGSRRYRLLSAVREVTRLPGGDVVALGWGPQVSRLSLSVPEGEPPTVAWTAGFDPEGHAPFDLTALPDGRIVAAWRFIGASRTTIHVACLDGADGTVRWRRRFRGREDQEYGLGGVVPGGDGRVDLVGTETTGDPVGWVRGLAPDGTNATGVRVDPPPSAVATVADGYVTATGSVAEGRLRIARYGPGWERRWRLPLQFDGGGRVVVTDLEADAGRVGVVGYAPLPVPTPFLVVLLADGSRPTSALFRTPPGGGDAVDHLGYTLAWTDEGPVIAGAAGTTEDRDAWVALVRPTAEGNPPTVRTTTESPVGTDSGGGRPGDDATATERPKGTSTSTPTVGTARATRTPVESPGFGVGAAALAVGATGRLLRRLAGDAEQ